MSMIKALFRTKLTQHLIIILFIFTFLLSIDAPNINHLTTTTKHRRPTSEGGADTAGKALNYGVVVLLAMLTTMFINHVRPQDPPPEGGGGGGDRGGVGYNVMKTLPIFVYTTRPRPRIGRESEVCECCWREFRDEEMVRWLPDCDHLFHLACINEWLCFNQTCPCCLAVVHHGFRHSTCDQVLHFPFQM